MSAALRQIVAALVAALLAGCAVTADYRPPQLDMPACWSEGADPTARAVSAESPWWRSFDDPELDLLVERALRGNLDLQLAGARLREARARGGTVASSWPSLEASASYLRERDSANAPSPVLVRRNGEVEAPGQQEHLFQAGFDAAWEIDIFGGRRRTVEAAQADFQSALYERGGVALTLVAEVCRNYLELRGFQQQEHLVGEALEAQRDLLGLVKVRQERGMATGMDVANAEAQLERSAAQLPPLQAAWKRTADRLALLVGERTATVAEELRSTQSRIAPPVAEPPVGLPSDLLRRRPDLRSAERQVAAAAARLGVARTDLYPKFTLLGRAGLASVAAGDFFNGDSLFWSIGPSISWPVFQGGRLKATIEVRDAQLQQALISYRRAILLGIEDVENARAGYRSAKAQQETLLRALHAREQSTALSGERYAAGLADFREVLIAQQALYELRAELARSESSVSIALVALYKALGGGWNLTVGESGEIGVPVPGGRGGER